MVKDEPKIIKATEKEIQQCLDIIQKDPDIVFIDDLTTELPYSRPTFYNKGLNRVDSIKKAIEDNRINLKKKLRSNWVKSDNPTLQIALYKLIGNEDEYYKLANAKQLIKNETPHQIIFQNVSKIDKRLLAHQVVTEEN